MLKGIPKILSPDLIRALMDMGHGDEIILADGNFPAATYAKRLLRCDGVTVAQLLEAILPFFPLDHAVERPGAVMSVRTDEKIPSVYALYEAVFIKQGHELKGFDHEERFDFYERAKKAYAIVITSDQAYKANLVLKKGVVR